MKIGILTYHFVSNFGANLQTLSTLSYFKKSGHEPIIINWVPSDLERYYRSVVPEEQNNAFHAFALRMYSPITRLCRTSQDIAMVIDQEKIDFVIIGSDAVLTYIPFVRRLHLGRHGLRYYKPCIDSNFPNAFWGDFILYTTRPVKLAIMSGSAQNTRYTSILSRRCFDIALRRFVYISVRDIWTKKMLSYLSNGKLNVEITPDPVFAFNYNVKIELSKKDILNRFNLQENYALLSVYNSRIEHSWKESLENQLAGKNITLYELPQANIRQNQSLKRKIAFPIDPIEWYCLIKYSKGYIGELMHPILVSLHNSVPFYAVDTYGFRSSNDYGIDVESSKTYQIINEFDMLTNYYNVNSSHGIESPVSVCNKLLSFDYSKCDANSLRMYKQYQRMMINIQNLF